MPYRSANARALSAAFLDGDWSVEGLVERGARLSGKRWRWLRPLAQRVTQAFLQPRPRQRALVAFLLSDRGFSRACEKYDLQLAGAMVDPPAMYRVGAAASWPIPSIRSGGELARWLEVTIGELEWFADRRSMECKRNKGPLRHYRYRPLTKRFGQIRMVEAPKPRLKAIQRRILSDILEHIPPHAAAHGFRRGRSIKSFASPHIGRRVVLKLDLQDFFPSIPRARVQAIFRTAGYPELVSDLLAGLCTNCTPQDAWPSDAGSLATSTPSHARWHYARPHLPQGAPTSPALASLCAYRLDRRLAGLARSAGASYTRYADDLAFSGGGDFERVVKRFHLHVCATVLEEGFTTHDRKTRVMRQGVCQRIAGIVVNERLNVPRSDYDRLKATLTNCIRLGSESQNRSGHHEYRSHLEGRVAFVEQVNPAKGRRLRELFDRITW